jgi:putative ABC transport system substrate-binding protein
MRRREFIARLGGAAVWPLAARAQQPDRMRRIAVLMDRDENDPEGKADLTAFTQGLGELGWTDGRNLRIDVRWTAGSVDRMRALAKELVGLRPEMILAASTPVTVALQRETRTIPIVFAPVADPVGSGFVASLPRPGGNITGFSFIEASMASKWLELLTEIAPGVRRVAIMFNPDTAPHVRSYFLPPFEAAARANLRSSLQEAARRVGIRSGRIEARIGLRMMPTFPRSPLALRNRRATQSGRPSARPGGPFKATMPIVATRWRVVLRRRASLDNLVNGH